MFRLIRDDEVARAELSAVRSEIDRVALLVTAMDERIASQADMIKRLGEQRDDAERSRAELAERIARMEDMISGLRRDHDALRAKTDDHDERLNAGDGDNLQIRANLKQLERQAEIDLRELRSDGQSLARTLLQLRRGLAATPGSVADDDQQTASSPALR